MAGTVAVTAGGTSVVGTGTAFTGAAGDEFILNGLSTRVASVNSPTSLTLDPTTPWPGSTLSGQANFVLMPVGPFWNSAINANLKLQAFLDGINAGSFTNLTATGAVTVGAGIELGSTVTAGTPYLDFHSSGNNVDYDARIIASGGTASAGHGRLDFDLATLGVNGDLIVTGAATIGGTLTAAAIAGLTTALSLAQGGTGQNTAALARTALGVEAAALVSLGLVGYCKLANGLILQWGTSVLTTSSGGLVSLTLPLTFPTACAQVVVCNGDANAVPGMLANIYAFTTTTLQFQSTSLSTGLPLQLDRAGILTMSKLATVDDNGLVTAFYDLQINEGGIPEGAILLTDDQWATWCQDTQGHQWVGSTLVSYTMPTEPTPPPEEITRGQFIRGLTAQDTITADEAVAWATTNTLPAKMEALIASLPEGDQVDDRLMILTAATIARHHPLTLALAAGEGWTDQQTDDFWIHNSTI